MRKKSEISTLLCGHSVEKREILSRQKIFRQINSLVIFLEKTLFSRNFSQLYGKISPRQQKFSQCYVFDFTKFLTSHCWKKNAFLHWIDSSRKQYITKKPCAGNNFCKTQFSQRDSMSKKPLNFSWQMGLACRGKYPLN